MTTPERDRTPAAPGAAPGAAARGGGRPVQASTLPARLKVAEILTLFRSFCEHPADPGELMASLGLAAKRGAYYRSLSGGLRQRLSIALIGNPRIAVPDEMTTGLDPQARRGTWQLIEDVRARGVTIILVTHYMDEAERLCDRVALLGRGRDHRPRPAPGLCHSRGRVRPAHRPPPERGEREGAAMSSVLRGRPARAPRAAFGRLLQAEAIYVPVLRGISDWTPPGAAVKALQAAMLGAFPPAGTLLAMVGYAAISGFLAVRFFRWE